MSITGTLNLIQNLFKLAKVPTINSEHSYNSFYIAQSKRDEALSLLKKLGYDDKFYGKIGTARYRNSKGGEIEIRFEIQSQLFAIQVLK